MADQMQAIKRRMKSVSNTERITNAMKLVSASKLKHATAKHMFISKDLKLVTEQVYGAVTKEGAPAHYRQERSGKTLYLVVTGSKGLCGGYNSNVTKEVQQIIDSGEEAVFLSFGTKGRDFCQRQACEIFPVKETIPGLLEIFGEPIDDWSYTQIQEISRQILDSYKKGEITKIVVIYTHYKNTIVQRLTSRQLFPLVTAQAEPEAFAANGYMEYEPCGEEFFDLFAVEYLALNLYGVIAESALCEHSARRMAMKNASDNAKEMLTELSVYYNRARQAAITNEIIEIAAGAEALNKGK